MHLTRFLFQAIIVLNVDVAMAQSMLSKTEHYAKCYAKLTDHPVELGSVDYLAVEAGTLDPVKACMKVFAKAIFTVEGDTRKLANAKDEISLSILRNFNAFHLSWFTINMVADGGVVGAASFLDMTAPALYLTDALFGKKHFKSIVTSQETLLGIRSGGDPAVYHINGFNMSGRSYVIGPMGKPGVAAGDDFSLIPPTDRVTVGALTGITKAKPKIIPLIKSMRGTAPLSDAQQAQRRLEGTDYDMARHYGGGILGNPVNFYTNDENRRPQDGGLNVHRRWANNTFYDLMCSKLPNLKETDTVVLAEFKKFAKSELSFRQSKTCLSCHVSLDNFAHAARNIEGRRLESGGFRRLVAAKHPKLVMAGMDLIIEHPQTKPTEPILDKDPYYHRRPPVGALIYNDFNGKLVNQPVTGLQDLGEKVAARDDIYMCAAKRYYSFLTGVDVSMAPIPIDKITKKPKDSDQFDYYHRQIVVGLSKRLKTGGSLSNLIEDILKTQAFKSRNPAAVGEK